MTEEMTTNEKSFSDLFGMKFKEDGSQTAKNYRNAKTFRKKNRKERRIEKAIVKRLSKIKK